MGWESYPIGEICRIQQGKTLLKRHMVDRGYPVFGANGRVGWAETFHYAEPVVILGCRGTCGSVHKTRRHAYVTNNAMAILPYDGEAVTQDYLFWILKNTDLSTSITGGVQQQITRRTLKHCEILLPPLDRQREFSVILDRVACVEHPHGQAASAASALSASLMDSLLDAGA